MVEDRRKLAKLCSKERGQEYVTRPGTHRKLLVGLGFFRGTFEGRKRNGEDRDTEGGGEGVGEEVK